MKDKSSYVIECACGQELASNTLHFVCPACGAAIEAAWVIDGEGFARVIATQERAK